MKYNFQTVSLKQIAASIQAIWLIEEYAIILRRSVWFKPPTLPIKLEAIEDIMIII